MDVGSEGGVIAAGGTPPSFDRLRGNIAVNRFARACIEALDAEGERLVGAARRREWGTEQCASSFAVANSPGAVVVPYPTYQTGAADRGFKLCHLIGSHRFADGFLGRVCRDEITARPRATRGLGSA